MNTAGAAAPLSAGVCTSPHRPATSRARFVALCAEPRRFASRKATDACAAASTAASRSPISRTLPTPPTARHRHRPPTPLHGGRPTGARRAADHPDKLTEPCDRRRVPEPRRRLQAQHLTRRLPAQRGGHRGAARLTDGTSSLHRRPPKSTLWQAFPSAPTMLISGRRSRCQPGEALHRRVGLTAHGQRDRKVDVIAAQPAARGTHAVRRQRVAQLPDGEVDAAATQVDRTGHHRDPPIDIGRLIVFPDAPDHICRVGSIRVIATRSSAPRQERTGAALSTGTSRRGYGRTPQSRPGRRRGPARPRRSSSPSRQAFWRSRRCPGTAAPRRRRSSPRRGLPHRRRGTRAWPIATRRHPPVPAAGPHGHLRCGPADRNSSQGRGPDAAGVTRRIILDEKRFRFVEFPGHGVRLGPRNRCTPTGPDCRRGLREPQRQPGIATPQRRLAGAQHVLRRGNDVGLELQSAATQDMPGIAFWFQS